MNNKENNLYINNKLIDKYNFEELDYLYIEEFKNNLYISDFNKEIKDNIIFDNLKTLDNIILESFKNKTINIYLSNIILNKLKCNFKINKLIINKNCIIKKIILTKNNFILTNINNKEYYYDF